jgi:hypothetical protein
LQGEVVAYPQNPKDYSFDFHPIYSPFDHGAGTKDSHAAERLQVGE